MQSKEARFLTLYDYMLNIIAMIAIFATLALGFIQVKEGQLNVVYLTSIVIEHHLNYLTFHLYLLYNMQSYS
jgi:ATP-binding cassette subfamily C protein CydC